LVTVEGGVITAAEFVPLEVVRWHQLRLDVSGLSSLDALARHFVGQARELVADARDRLHAVRLLIQGESALHRLEAEEPGSIAAAIQAATQDLEDTDIWIEQIRLNLQSPMDRTAMAGRADAIGEVVRLVDVVSTDEGQLKAWFSQQLAEMKDLPGALADVDPMTFDVATMRAFLADAEATVLAQISGITTEGGVQ
jgi:exonuclease SbcD